MGALKKYAKIFTIGLSDAFAWRASYFMYALTLSCGVGALIMFWMAVYKDGNQIGTFSLEQLVIYYIAGAVIHVIFDRGFSWDIMTMTTTGALSQYLIKPISFFNYRLAQELGSKAAMLLIYGIPTITAAVIFRDYLPHDGVTWALIFASLTLGFVLQYFVGFIFGIAAVWFEQPYVTIIVFHAVSSMLSGQLIPLSLMPPWLHTIATHSPFPYLIGIPLQLILGQRTSISPTELWVGILWLFVLAFSCRLIWRKAAYQYEAGGL